MQKFLLVVGQRTSYMEATCPCFQGELFLGIIFFFFNTIEYKVAYLYHLRLITWIGRLGGKKVFTSHTSAFLVWFSLGL